MINKNRYQNEHDLPLGISMALGQNPLLLKMFTELTPDQRESFVSSNVNSRPPRHINYTNGIPQVYDEPVERRRFE